METTSEKMAMSTSGILLNIDEILSDNGTSREEIIKKNKDYKVVFDKADEFYTVYQKNPSEAIGNALNNFIITIYQKLKKDYPDIFEPKKTKVKEKIEIKSNPVEKSKETANFFIQNGDREGLEDLFDELGKEQTKRVISADNYLIFETALKTHNPLLIESILSFIQKNKMTADLLEVRGGYFFNLIMIEDDMVRIKSTLIDELKQHPDIAKKALSNNVALVHAIESQDERLIDKMKELYKETGLESELRTDIKREIENIKENTEYEKIISKIRSGTMVLDIPIYTQSGELCRFQVIPFNKNLEITSGIVTATENYLLIYPMAQKNLFHNGNGDVIFEGNGYVVEKHIPVEFEYKYGHTIYEMTTAFNNMRKLPTATDLIAMLFVANFSSGFISEMLSVKSNKMAAAQKDYITRLETAMEDPYTNKIGNRVFNITKVHLETLHRFGFLDMEYCPTRMLYLVVALHSHNFPAFTHPFEFVALNVSNNPFVFDTFGGMYMDSEIVTDGDLMLVNMRDATGSKGLPTETMRLIYANVLARPETAVKKLGIISRFMPFIYSEARSTGNMPMFKMRELVCENRNLNWGMYKCGNDEQKGVFVNSYYVSNLLFGAPENYEHYLYKGKISDIIYTDPSYGLMLQMNNTAAVFRAVNGLTFLGNNFGDANKYLKDNIIKLTLAPLFKTKIANELLSKKEPAMVFDIYPEAGFKANVKPKKPIDIATKKQVKKVTVKVYRRDDRIYLPTNEAKDEFSNPSTLAIFMAVKSLKGDQRDVAILNELYRTKHKVSVSELLYLGFDVGRYGYGKDDSFKVDYKGVYSLYFAKPTDTRLTIEKL